MTKRDLEQLVTSDLRAQLAALLGREPHLSPKEAMEKITQELLKNNPFVPPEGDKCPINRLPDELLSQIFEGGMCIELEEKRFEEDGDDDHEGLDDSDDEDDNSDEDDGENGNEIIVDVTDKDEDEWSDVDEEDEPRKRKRRQKGGEYNSRAEGSDDDEDEDDEDVEEKVLPFQVLVSHVCRRWRAIALDTPFLWALLEFEKGTPLDKYKAYINRAKTAPIDISIDCTFADAFRDEPDLQVIESGNRERELVECLKNSIAHPDPSLPDFFGDPNWHLQPGLDEPLSERDPLDDHYYSITELSEILDLIMPHVSHWRALVVSVSDYRWIYLLLARLHQCGPAEYLEVFELYHYEDDDDDRDSFLPRRLATKFTPFHGRAPRLRDCAFWGIHLDWDASLGMLRGLQDLELAYHTEEARPSFKALATVLDSSPDIRVLTLCLSGPRGTEDNWRDEGVPPIQIPSLQSLALRYHEPRYACSLLRFLDTPNVYNLSVDFDEVDYSDFAKELCKAAHGRSKSLLAGLQSFKISGLPCSRAWVTKILEQLVNLRSLNLNCTGQEEEFFEALRKTTRTNTDTGSLSSPGRAYCPALESITTAGITGRQMKEFVEARSKAGAPVRRVFMSEQDEVDAVSERWLKAHVKEFEYFEPSDSEEEVSEVDSFDSMVGELALDLADEDVWYI